MTLAVGPGVDNGTTFGGGAMGISPLAGSGYIQQTTPANVTVGVAVSDSLFTYNGPAVTTVGTALGIYGIMSANATIAASEVTYITDKTLHESVTLMDILAASGPGQGSKIAMWTGQLGSPGTLQAAGITLVPGSPTTYSGAASTAVAFSINNGDNVEVEQVYTLAGDPDADATVNLGDNPGDNGLTMNGVTPTLVPEPGVLSLFGLGVAALLVCRKRARG